MKPLVILTMAAVVLVVFLLGGAVGIWFSQHYRIVPVDAPLEQAASAMHTAAEQYAPPPARVPTENTPPPAFPASTEIIETPASSPKGAAERGPFSYHFVPGETDHYRIDADIHGMGIDLGQGAKIDLGFNARLALNTETVSSDGSGNLALNFKNVDMTGEFMGSPIKLHQSPDSTQFKMNSGTQIDSNQGISLGLIPSLDFFKQTIRMTVAQNGEVTKLTGAEGFEQMLAPMTRLSSDTMEKAGLHPNAQWTSEFLMPVPGLGSGVKTVTHNTFTGYNTINGRQCAVVQQVMDSSQTGGSLTAQSGGLEGMLGFAMPLFSIVGRNTIYFDTANGKLVRCDLNLEFNMQLGEQLKSLTDLMQTYGELLGDYSGGKPSAAPKNTKDMSVKIAGTMALEDGPAPGGEGDGASGGNGNAVKAPSKQIDPVRFVEPGEPVVR